MAPIVIADSDDEDDPGYSPPAQSPSANVTRSTERVSYSESTDPLFFQSVFDEQNEAARQLTLEAVEAPLEQGDGAEDGSMSRRGGRGHSPMSTDPLHIQADESLMHSEPKNDRILKDMSGSVDHTWDVPSSPEDMFKATTAKGSKQVRRLGRTSQEKSFRRSSSKQLEREADDHHEDQSGRRKRRKLITRHNTTLDTEDMDLVPLPSTHDVGQDLATPMPSTMLPPTLPIDRSSFVVAPKAPTSSKRKEYQSFALESDIEPSQDQGPSRPVPGGLLLSSGSATNMNTPRSNVPSSRNLETDFVDDLVTPSKEPDLPRQDMGWQSSPDAITVAGPIRTSKQIVKKRESSRDSSPLSSPVPPEEEEDEFAPVPAPAPAREDNYHEDHDDGSDSDFAAKKPAKPKKKRGRPRKNPTAEEIPKPISTPKAEATEETSNTKTKKKRGRPRKSDPPTTVKEKAAVEGASIIHEEHVTTETKDIKQPMQEAKATAEDVCQLELTETEVSTEMSDLIKETKNVVPEAKETKTPAKTMNALAGSLTAGKPVYRVGLSKKTRIAPLLKIVRKD